MQNAFIIDGIKFYPGSNPLSPSKRYQIQKVLPTSEVWYHENTANSSFSSWQETLKSFFSLS